MQELEKRIDDQKIMLQEKRERADEVLNEYHEAQAECKDNLDEMWSKLGCPSTLISELTFDEIFGHPKPSVISVSPRSASSTMLKIVKLLSRVPLKRTKLFLLVDKNLPLPVTTKATISQITVNQTIISRLRLR